MSKQFWIKTFSPSLNKSGQDSSEFSSLWGRKLFHHNSSPYSPIFTCPVLTWLIAVDSASTSPENGADTEPVWIEKERRKFHHDKPPSLLLKETPDCVLRDFRSTPSIYGFALIVTNHKIYHLRSKILFNTPVCCGRHKWQNLPLEKQGTMSIYGFALVVTNDKIYHLRIKLNYYQ